MNKCPFDGELIIRGLLRINQASGHELFMPESPLISSIEVPKSARHKSERLLAR